MLYFYTVAEYLYITLFGGKKELQKCGSFGYRANAFMQPPRRST